MTCKELRLNCADSMCLDEIRGLLYVSCCNRIKVFCFPSLEEVEAFPNDPNSCLYLSDDGNYLYSVTTNNTIKVYDVSNRKAVCIYHCEKRRSLYNHLDAAIISGCDLYLGIDDSLVRYSIDGDIVTENVLIRNNGLKGENSIKENGNPYVASVDFLDNRVVMSEYTPGLGRTDIFEVNPLSGSHKLICTLYGTESMCFSGLKILGKNTYLVCSRHFMKESSIVSFGSDNELVVLESFNIGGIVFPTISPQREYLAGIVITGLNSGMSIRVYRTNDWSIAHRDIDVSCGLARFSSLGHYLLITGYCPRIYEL